MRRTVPLIVSIILLSAACGDEASDSTPVEEKSLELRRDAGAGGPIAAGAIARFSLAGAACLPGTSCKTPLVEAVAVSFEPEGAEIVGEPTIEAGRAVFEVRTASAGSLVVRAAAETQLGSREAAFEVDVVEIASIEVTPVCPSELGGQEPLENRLAGGFAMAVDSEVGLDVVMKDAAGVTLTGYGLLGVDVEGEGFGLVAPTDEQAPTLLAATTVGEGVVTAILGDASPLTVRAYTFDQVDGFLIATQSGEQEAAFGGDRSGAVGLAVRVEVLATIRADLACSLPFDAKFTAGPAEVCALVGDEPQVAAPWVAVELVSAGNCEVNAALTNANGRGHQETVSIVVE